MAGIYLHIPFCKQACYYCDFHFSTSLKKKAVLVTCLVKELELRKGELQSEAIETIYFGGGTPSLLSIEEIQLLIDTIHENYKVVPNPEITLEANADDVSKNQLIQLYKTPINRLSIGIQSFFEEDLQLMNRAHNAQEAKECLSMAIRYFDNITIDLIYGIPNMSNERWRENLQIAFDFGINHISSYALTVEPKTALYSFIKQGKYPDVDEAVAKAHFDILVAETAKNGFVHYEISNFGKPNYFSKHNTSYWLGKKYMGIGPSAHSFNKTHRSWNIPNNAKYIKAIQQGKLPSEEEKLTVNNQFNEYLMTGLRTIWGVSLEKIAQEFGEELKIELLHNAEKFINQDLLTIEYDTLHSKEEILKTTEKGKFLADGLASELFII
ncbi:radical SAM family heme chaperone HemW [Tenacibaculum tangerinum]|uniref:Heme chaperone HemW n=1 Tax=Tenacibaculum tangerinum TaxID=3038772 RepID=A0ABY8KY87_9FLAO|nr:radical SAM family heme chaperone HemW [Tenacibaculum tangerinum]WGH74201.1 radical SAM family heme chaperone HemW [Tenacibaculum tangerinum]